MTENQSSNINNYKNKLEKFQPTISQIICNEQKDDVLIKSLQDESNAIFKQFFRARLWIQWQPIIDEINKSIYYLLTTVSGHQTLGEEYCQIICIDYNQYLIPSLWRRLTLAAIYSFRTRFVNFFKNLATNNDHNHDGMVAENLQFLIDSIKKINVAIFFLQGQYPDLTKRFLSIRYLSTSVKSSSTDYNQTTFKILSFLTIIQVILSFYAKYMIITKKSKTKHINISIDNTKESIHSHNNDGKRCPLCFSSYQNPTLLFCGHIFCWDCLSDWMLTTSTSARQQQGHFERKDECPICKMKINDTKQFVLLHNF